MQMSMLIKSKTRERKILSSTVEPSSSEWLWLCHDSNGRPLLKEYFNGKWQSLVSNSVTTDDFSSRLRDLRDYVDKRFSSLYIPSVDLSPYYTKTEIDGLLADFQPSVTPQDGITPHIDINTGNWFIGEENTGWPATGTGIRNISYRGSNVSGAANVLTIETTDGNSRSFNIYNGKDGAPGEPGSPGSGTQPEYIETEVLQLGMGPFSDAVDKAESGHGAVMFQWILSQNDPNGIPFKKIIWHIGNGVFIDALGSIITNE